MSVTSSSSTSESEFQSEAETENFVRITLDWLAIPRNKTPLRKGITNAIHATPRFGYDPDDGGEDDLDGATEMDSAESALDAKATSKQLDVPDIDTLPSEILNDPRKWVPGRIPYERGCVPRNCSKHPISLQRLCGVPRIRRRIFTDSNGTWTDS